ncbi:hypothetical protein [Inquilinus limosus]|uniref:MalT-like TPR region domain-containing protein n=1 Tax=Inquilinus limosus TaxID=171674 RepID=A0A211ZUW2_9PROT|nr:hypothetical protein [Inquilinus limosus]OWJ69055.1 hypothetical protein BWR60_00460 [Inquilinus limosus]
MDTESNRSRLTHESFTEDIRAAPEWRFSATGEADLGITLAAHSSRMLLDLSMPDECLTWCSTALAHIDERDRISLRGLRFQKALALSLMHTSENDYCLDDVIHQALEMGVALGARQSQPRLLAGLNIYLTRRDDFAAALEAAECFNAVAGESRDAVETVATEWMLRAPQHLIGRQRLGLEILDQGFSHANELGNRKIHYFGFDNGRRAIITRTWAAWPRGRPDRAIHYANEALDASIEPMPRSRSASLISTPPLSSSGCGPWSGQRRRSMRSLTSRRGIG